MLGRLKQKVSYGLTIHYLLDRLSSMGICCRPFYIVEEGRLPINPENLKAGIEAYEACFLTHDEIKRMAGHSECGHEESVFMDRLSSGCLCFGLKHNSELMAYMWCNFKRIESYMSFAIKAGSVYLFDAWTYKKYRGKNLAPVLRNQLYLNLRKMGYERYYSISDAFNTPAMNFKKKLGAKNIQLTLHLKFFNRFQKNIMIKNIEYSIV